MDTTTERLAAYAMDLSYEDLPPEVVDRTKRLILDTIGCALGASPYKAPTAARAVAGDSMSKTPATVMVSGHQASPDLAAFANGVMTRYLDYNDYYHNIGGGHPSDTLAPALAAAEAANGDGKAAILGMVLGYEIILGLGDSAASTKTPGWGSGSFQVIAAAISASKLMGLTKEQTEHAVSMAISSHLSNGRSRGGQISNWKAATSANDSRNGVFCALAARKGLTGPNGAFEGRRGFFELTGNKFDVLPLGGEKGTQFRIMGAQVKAHPAGYPSHSGIDAAVELHPKIKNPADIKEVRMFTARSGMGYANEQEAWHPETRERADHSHAFILSLALTEGSVQVRHFEEAYYKRPAIVELMQKVKVSVGEESEKAYHENHDGMPLAVLEVEMKSGEVHKTKKGFDRTRAEFLRTDAGQDKKLRPMIDAVLPKAQGDQLVKSLRTLEQQRSLKDVLALTVPAKK